MGDNIHDSPFPSNSEKSFLLSKISMAYRRKIISRAFTFVPPLLTFCECVPILRFKYYDTLSCAKWLAMTSSLIMSRPSCPNMSVVQTIEPTTRTCLSDWHPQRNCHVWNHRPFDRYDPNLQHWTDQWYHAYFHLSCAITKSKCSIVHIRQKGTL